MPVENLPIREVAAEIQPDRLRGKGFPRPQRVSIIEGVDSEKERAIYVYLVYPNNTPDTVLSWDKIKKMVGWVREYVWDHTGQTTWPYVKVRKEQELPPELS